MSLPQELNIQKNVPLALMTSWQVGGSAEFFSSPFTVEELINVTQWALNSSTPITVFSGGSNILVADAGIKGLVISLSKLKQLKHFVVDGKLQLHAEAGCPKSEILKLFLKYKLAPALFLAGIPGDVGGGVVMNAGVGEAIAPREFCEIVTAIEVLDLESRAIKKISSKDIHWEYRHSSGWQPGIITAVEMAWPLTQIEDILEQVRTANRLRFQRQPLELPSCGSVFRNPPGLKSAQLIQDCELKGFTIGGAQVSVKHSNFIVNIGAATADNICQLIQYVKRTVKNKKGVDLQEEVVYLGQWPKE